MKVDIRHFQPGDIDRIAVTMSPIDVLECKVAGHSPAQALANAHKTSALSWTGEIDGWPEAMFGVVPRSMLSEYGYPWFLGSNRARRAQRQFLTLAPKVLAMIEYVYPKLEGVVHLDNTAAIRWLQRLDFVLDLPATKISGEPMLRFHKGF